jgi:hypothetical protein
MKFLEGFGLRGRDRQTAAGPPAWGESLWPQGAKVAPSGRPPVHGPGTPGPPAPPNALPVFLGPGVSGNLPGRRIGAGKESPGWTSPDDLPDRGGAREASMREREGRPENHAREGWESSPRRSVSGLSRADRTGCAPGGPGGNEGRQKAIPEIHPRERGVAPTGLRRFCSVPGKGARPGETLPGRGALPGAAGKVRWPSGRRRPSRDSEIRDLRFIRPAVFAEEARRLRLRAAVPPFWKTMATFCPSPGFRIRSGQMSGGNSCLGVPVRARTFHPRPEDRCSFP